MSNRYLIDIRQVTLVPVIVEADSATEAIESAIAGFGETGDPTPTTPEIIAVRRLES